MQITQVKNNIKLYDDMSSRQSENESIIECKQAEIADNKRRLAEIEKSNQDLQISNEQAIKTLNQS